MDVFDHVDVKDLICPYCGHNQDVPHEHLDDNKDQETQIVKCDYCKMNFKAMIDFDPRFTTEVLETDEYLDDL
jgi:uncharacterized Zn finger protein